MLLCPMNSLPAKASEAEAVIRCLIVEDDPEFARLLAEVVRAEGGLPVVCGSVRSAQETVQQRSFEAVVLDNHLPDGKGFNLYFDLARRDPNLTIVVLTGLPELAHAVQLTRQGLFDYLAKPIARAEFAQCFRRIQTRVQHRKNRLESQDLVLESRAMREVAQALQQAARHRTATVLLTGETGVGKDLVARVLHQWSCAGQSPPPFVALNCAALPAEMFEAELFGAERGAYTGADRARPGLAGAAREGTLFLDEIAEVPLGQQAKLLRFLESREYRPLGSAVAKPFEGRFIAATNRSLRDEVRAGRFREDLLYRLDVFTIRVPPLRERQEEIPTLAEVLLSQLARKYNRVSPQIRPEDYVALRQYGFPGNVRELRNLLERSLLRTAPEECWLALDCDWLTMVTPAEPPVPAPPLQSRTAPAEEPNRPLTPLELLEYQLIRKTLAQERGGIRRTAAKLGLTHQTLLRRLQKWPELRPKQTGDE